MVSDQAMTSHIGGWRSSHNDVGLADGSNGKYASPSQEDNDLLVFHRASGCVLNALADVDHQTSESVVSTDATISVPTNIVEARDLWS